jgi:myo-inositol 2-dehydrogenase/D-chiro-inositol 1-dehydrogenase
MGRHATPAVKVALLGRGTMGTFHTETLSSEGVEVLAWDVDPSRRIAGSLEAALDAADAVVIATPAATHAELLRRCIERGLPAFCEKPLALDLSEAASLTELVETTGATVQVGFQRRFDAAFAALRGRYAAGELGAARTFAMATFDRVPPPPAYIPTSGGLFRDMHIHDFDLVRWLLADEVEEVHAFGAVLVDGVFAEHGDVDSSVIALRMRRGALGVLTGARANPAGYTARLDVYGSLDSASVREERPHQGFLDRYPDAYRAEIRAFLGAARGEAPSACTARDGLEALRVAEAATRSVAEERPIRLEEV